MTLLLDWPNNRPSVTTKLAVPAFSSMTMSCTYRLGVASTVSLSTMVTRASLMMVALVGEDRSKAKCSSDSTEVSFLSSMRTILVVSPGAKFSVPLSP